MTNPKSISIIVAEQVKILGSQKVVDTVVAKLVESEVAKRAEALAAAIKLSEDTLRELRKASKADQISIAADGTKTELFSQKAFEAKRKLEDKLARIDKVVENSIQSGDWSKLYELVKNGSNSSEQTPVSDDSGSN